MRTISGNIYLQWQAHGNSAQWKMGTSSDGPFSSLNSYAIAPGSDCTFFFSTNQSSQAVFATMTDGGFTAGAQFGGELGPTATLTHATTGSLFLQAGQLLSGDPKIQLSSNVSDPPSCTMDWDGKNWTVTDPNGRSLSVDPDDGRYHLYAPSGSATVSVVDGTVEGSPHYCAVYYGSRGTNSGYTQSETEISSTQPVPVTIRGDAGFDCTLNLFEKLSPSGSDTIAS